MKRRLVWALAGWMALSAGMGGAAGAEGAGTDALAFPVDDYTEETMTVTTAGGDREVTYRYYQDIVYVKNPVDPAYQSLNVKVPVAIDGVDIDASGAPILFSNSVGGYMASSVGGGMPDGGERPEGMELPADGGQGGGPGGMLPGDGGDRTTSRNLALAAGYVVVEVGARGRNNETDDGRYYGKAPAAIVDLKAAVRYLRANDDVMPGNAEWIVSIGTSAGGALSALLGASGDSDLYADALAGLGAADASDAIFASADYCPITDLEHADMMYEWMFGDVPRGGALVDQTDSAALAAAYPAYQAALGLSGQDGFGALTADNYAGYLLTAYLQPSAERYLAGLDEDARTAYLGANPWIAWDGTNATFAWADYQQHFGSRKKDVHAFDAPDLSSGENSLFGSETVNARHFTAYAQQAETGDAALPEDVQAQVTAMNPMGFITANGEGVAQHWWIRHGTLDSDTSLPVIVNLATALENAGKDVNAWLYWDAGHGADEDPDAFVAWIGTITGYGA